MEIPTYLAMSPGELASGCPSDSLPAWMACHFSSTGQGLTNLPDSLPEGAMLILDDSVPMTVQEPDQILQQLADCAEAFRCSGVLLDFQRPVSPALAGLTELLTEALPCPAAVSEPYAAGLSCPVFVSAPPAHVPLAAHLAPWQGRELWLELAPAPETATVTENGTVFTPLAALPREEAFGAAPDCHYRLAQTGDSAVFTIFRNGEDLAGLLREAQTLGVTRAVGLWQELRNL